MQTWIRKLRARRDQAGFSAVEMLAVVALIGIMVLVTTPAMMDFFNAMKVRTAAHRFMSHLRLCRQVAVSRRTEVLMELQRTHPGSTAGYKAWEERNDDLLRDDNGVDAADADDDEKWVIKDEKGMETDRVTFIDSYNDITPSIPGDDPGTSVMGGNGRMILRFFPNGQVVRVAANGDSIVTDTLLRMRLQRKINGSRMDRHDVTINRAGKVGSDFTRVAP
jgi:prepilin-type N-terminal cleavage/methylation domain-containing protein